ncbi:MAG: ATP-binding cassette domain-containing protein [Candidatus Thermoplasmatota archaeon]|nr:ATP-binding cassette domain-containing protein [Candidatus Thermoplasmatota archaeon]
MEKNDNKILGIDSIKVERNGKTIIKGLSLSVNRGKIHAVIGPNGSGKSTLAYTIMGIYKPSTGKIFFEGKDITSHLIHERAKMGITLAWQEPARFEGLLVRDYLSIGGNNIERALKMVNLDPRRCLNRAIDDSLSGGERKRIELASIIMMTPKLAILDEPDSGIDFVSLDDLLNVIVSLKKEGITVLLITHREEVARVADEASLICDGYLVKNGSTWEVTKFFRKMCGKCPSGKYLEVKKNGSPRSI